MKVKKFYKTISTFLLVFFWLFLSWPTLWKNPEFPPSIHKVKAATATYCFNSYSSSTWDAAPTNIVDCSTSTGTADNNNGHYVHFDASEYTSGGSGTITKVETRVYYKNNWSSSQTTRNNVARLQPYFAGTNAGDTHNDSVGNHSTAAWSATFDITSDTNAPSTWTWADVANLDMRLIDYRPSSGQITVYRVEMIVTYNLPPTISVSQPDGTGDTVIVGQSYNITYDLSDVEEAATVDFYYDSNATGLDGTAITGCQNQAEGSGVTCSWNTTGMTLGDYYVYGIASDGVNSDVSDYSPGVIGIQTVTVSVTITSTANNPFDYGIIAPSSSKNTVQLSKTQTAQNNGNVAEDFNIKTSNATGGTQWSLGSSPGSDVFVHEYSTSSGPPWTKFTTAGSYESTPLVTNVLVGNSQNFDLQITVPSSTSDYQQKSITVTIQAVQH